MKLESESKVMPKELIASFYQALTQHTPNPTTELRYNSPFQLLVSVVLSAQSTDIGVNKATKGLFEIAQTAELMSKLTVENIAEKIKTLNFYRNKAKYLAELSQIISVSYQDKIPVTREELEALPGVGRKTANVVLNTIWGQGTIAVDTHIFRVSNRTGLAKGKTVLEVEKKLLKRTPSHFLKDAHHLLILHGRYTCKARKPLCSTCPVYKSCQFFNKVPS